MKAFLDSDSGEEIDVNFITFYTDYEKAANLCNSIRGENESLTTNFVKIHSNEKFTNDFKQKSVAILSFLKSNSLIKDDSLWFVLDAYDTLVLSNNMTFTPPLDGKVLFNAETNCYPDASLATKYPYKETRYEYLNAGAYVGRKKDIIALLEQCIPYMGNGNIDQLVFSRKYVEDGLNGIIQLDYNCEIFQTLYQIPQDECLSYSNIVGEARYLYNKETDTFPFIIHGNGLSDMSQFLAPAKPRYQEWQQDILNEKIVIYTPCSRPNNLEAMHKSIVKSCGSRNNFEWIVCFDSDDIPNDKIIANTTLNEKNAASRSGNAQRNACIDHAAANYDGNTWMYCLDDDNIMHEDLYKELMAQPDDVDMVIFQQLSHNGKKRMGASDVIGVGQNDTANFAVRLKTIKDVRWVLDKYEADGIFALDVSKNAKNIVRVHKPLCYFNYLNPRRS